MSEIYTERLTLRSRDVDMFRRLRTSELFKLLQAGMLGFFLAVIVVRTRNLWWAVVVHALNDFVLLFLSNGIARAPIMTEYVSVDDAMANIALYLIVYVLYIPMMVGSINLLRESKPWRGAFIDDGTTPRS